MALRRIPALTPDSLKKVSRGKLETIVRLCGPFVEERLSALETGADMFRRQRSFADRLHGPLRAAWLALRDLPHLGEAGAARVLLFASPHSLIPVDAAMTRLAVRLGLVEPTDNLTPTLSERAASDRTRASGRRVHAPPGRPLPGASCALDLRRGQSALRHLSDCGGVPVQFSEAIRRRSAFT